MKISETLLPEFDEEMASTRKFLELVPDENWDGSPMKSRWPLAGWPGM